MHPEPTGKQAPVALAVLEQAVDWMLRLQAQPNDARIHEGCMRWRQQAPEHAHAWARIERLQDLIGRIPPELALPVLDRASDPGRRRATKRIAALATLAVPGIWAGHVAWERAQPGQRVHTATGERRRLILPDGGRLDLASDTAIEIDYGDALRRLRLRHGQIAIETAMDTWQPPRPFVVVTPQGTLLALGTRFDVRIEPDGSCRVVVPQGAVQVSTAGKADAGTVVHAGRMLRFRATGASTPTAASGNELAWRDGMLAADAMQMGELLTELARYRRGVLRWDPEVAALRVSGAFPLDDTDRSLAMLKNACPIQIQRRLGGLWTLVSLHPHEPSSRH